MGLKYNRRLNRLKGYDYTQDGYYFVTICVKGRQHVFGMVKDGAMFLEARGHIIKEYWEKLPKHYPNCSLDEYIIMPDHMHGIIIIDNSVGNSFKPFPTQRLHGLSEMVRGFKTFSSKEINRQEGVERFEWQKSFHDHIIRNEQALLKLRKYMHENPLRWGRG